MRFVTENQLDEWVRGNSQAARGLVVELVSRLVAASSPSPRDCRFPLADSIGQHGADGVLDAVVGWEPYVPEGKSYWEVGVSLEARKKANEDYKELTKAVPEEVRKLSTFVFVTPLSGVRDWPSTWKEDGQEDWLRKKRELNQWKEVKLIDGTRLVDWMHSFPAVELWFAQEAFGLPVQDVETLEGRWRTTKSIGEPPSLIPEVFLAGRQEAARRLQDFWDGQSLKLRLDTRFPDLIADFVAAHVHTLAEEKRAEILGSCLVVSTAEAWKKLVTHREKLTLIADVTLDLSGDLGLRLIQQARQNRHGIIFAGQSSGIPDPSRVVLPDPRPHQVQEALIKAGYPEDRARMLAQRSEGNLPGLLRCLQNLAVSPAWASGAVADDLTIAQLLGAWTESNGEDQAAAELLSGKAYGEWIQKVREAAAQPSTPLVHQERQWRFVLRYEGWYALGSRIYDDHLSRFRELALRVLGTVDPKFDLPKEERALAGLKGRVLPHSDLLRSGIADSLALLGSHPGALSNCSRGQPAATAGRVVRELLSSRDWRLWASLNYLQPLLAETSPNEYLTQLEEALQDCPSLFEDLYSEEGVGSAACSHISGILWGLERLAWDEQLLARVALVIGRLAALDPGGHFAHRPSESLTSVFLPWLPQTAAPLDKKIDVVGALLQDLPDVGWKLLLTLLPGHRKVAFSNSRPAWRNLIPEGWTKGVSQAEYFQQVTAYLHLAMDTAQTSGQLGCLVDMLDDLTVELRAELLEQLEAKSLILPPSEQAAIWERLTHLIRRHERASHTDWALPAEELEKIKVVSERLKPDDPFFKYQRLFGSSTFDLMDGEGSYEQQLATLETKQQSAIHDLLSLSSLERVLEFAAEVEAPSKVGLALGNLAVDREEIDTELLPSRLLPESRQGQQFVGGFVWGRYRTFGWEWVAQQLTRSIEPPELGQFLAFLPFQPETWRRVEHYLGDQENHYWSRAGINVFQADNDLGYAAEKFLEHGRPYGAIRCLHQMLHDQLTFAPELAVRALDGALNSSDPVNTQDDYVIEELIKHLQSDPNMDQDELGLLEFYYLGLLDEHRRGKPKVLWRRLATFPDFFVKVVQLVYRSTDGEPQASEEVVENPWASQAFRLLWDWKLPPGNLPDGSFSGPALTDWLEKVEELTRASGHFEISMEQVGKVLKWAPPDPDGLWIHRGVAAVLNREGAKHLRTGFYHESLNSRGAHYVDPSGKPERELAEDYRRKAEAVENACFVRLATLMRELAEFYDREAERNISQSR